MLDSSNHLSRTAPGGPAVTETILVVDDEIANLRLFSTMLGDRYEIKTASTGREGLEKAIELSPDLILLDVMMNDMSGIEVCKALKTDPATTAIPVIFVTSLDDAHNEQHGLTVGAVDYCAKPIHPAVLQARVRVHLEHRQYTRYLETLVDQRTRSLGEARRQAQLLLQEQQAWSART